MKTSGKANETWPATISRKPSHISKLPDYVVTIEMGPFIRPFGRKCGHKGTFRLRDTESWTEHQSSSRRRELDSVKKLRYKTLSQFIFT